MNENLKGDTFEAVKFKVELGIFRHFDSFLSDLRMKVKRGEIEAAEALRLWEKVKYPCYLCSKRNVAKLLEA